MPRSQYSAVYGPLLTGTAFLLSAPTIFILGTDNAVYKILTMLATSNSWLLWPGDVDLQLNQFNRTIGRQLPVHRKRTNKGSSRAENAVVLSTGDQSGQAGDRDP